MLRANVSPSTVTGIEVGGQDQPFGQNAYSRTSQQTYRDVAGTAQDTWSIGANKVNEFRFQYARRGLQYFYSNAPGGGDVAVNIPGFGYFGREPYSYIRRVEQRYQFTDNFSIAHGGHDFKFGHGRQGNVELLQHMGAKLNFEVLGINLVPGPDEAEPVSSTRIRQFLIDGDVEAAAQLLGRPHEVRGVVMHGDARGRELGFPTANVAVPEDILLPVDGIYAGWYERPSGDVRAAAISLGRRPQFYVDADSSLLEAYLLDFDGDLYDQPAKVRFVARLRGEQRFESVDALVAQMGRDVDAARAALNPPK